MGSIGVNTGRLTSSQIGALLTGNAEKGRTGTVSWYGSIPDRIFIDNELGRGGTTINFTGIPQDIRERFLSSLRGRSNVDNSQSTYNRVYRESLAANLPEPIARRIAEDARERVFRDILNGVIARNRNFSGITINNRYNRNRNVYGR